VEQLVLQELLARLVQQARLVQRDLQVQPQQSLDQQVRQVHQSQVQQVRKGRQLLFKVHIKTTLRLLQELAQPQVQLGTLG
jgi:hypothetical protein